MKLFVIYFVKTGSMGYQWDTSPEVIDKQWQTLIESDTVLRARMMEVPYNNETVGAPGPGNVRGFEQWLNEKECKTTRIYEHPDLDSFLKSL